MSPVIQAKLLRALEDNQVTRIGSVRPRRIDVRFVAATNRHLRDGAGDVRMRQDLYFRLNGISVRIPPLRDRPNEIIPLATHFLAAASARSRKCELHLSGEAIEALLSHRWPGNVRELRHVVERAALLCDGAAIRGHHLLLDAAPIEAGDDRGPARTGPLRGKDAGPLENMASWISPRAKVERLERARMVDALQVCVGNQSRAARMLGIPRRTFVKKMVRYDIPRPRDERHHVDHHDSDAEAEAEAEEGAT